MISFLNSNSNTVSRNIEVNFVSEPTNFKITKSIVRFDKTFAFGWSADDSLVDSYNIALPTFKGGTVIHKDGVVLGYPGLYYTDGCGNDIPFNFEMKLVTFAIGEAPSSRYLSYSQIDKAYVMGAGFVNHSYGHAAQDADFSSDPAIKEQQLIGQITDGFNQIKNRTGIRMTKFGPPSNYAPYFPVAYNMYLNKDKVSFLSAMRPDISTTERQRYGCETNSMEFYATLTDIGTGAIRDFSRWTDGTIKHTSEDTEYIDQVISATTENNHYWFSIGSHQIGSEYGSGDTYSASYGGFRWLTFKSFFERLENTYGRNGADNMYMDSDSNIWEYVQCYKFSKIGINNVSPIRKNISIDFSECSPTFRYYTCSFVIFSDTDISSINITGYDTSSYKLNYKDLGNGNVLVNVQYMPQYERAKFNRLRALSLVETLEFTSLESDKISAELALNDVNNGTFKTSLQTRINNVEVISESVVARIDFGFGVSSLTPIPWNNISASGSTALTGIGAGIANLVNISSEATGWSLFVTKGGFTGAVSSTVGDDGTLIYPLSAHKDALIISAGNYVEMTLGNLNPAKKYDIIMYGSRFVSLLQKYTVNGVSKTYQVQNNRTVTCDFLNNTGKDNFLIRVEGDTPTITGLLSVIEIIEHL